MITLAIGYYCLACFILSQIALLFHHEEKFKSKRTFVHIASAIYALTAGLLLNWQL